MSTLKIEFLTTAKLCKGNFRQWRFVVECHLKHHKVYEYVVNDTKPVKEHGESDSVFKRRVDMWASENNLAELIIAGSIEVDQQEHIECCVSAHEMYAALEGVHQRSDPANKLAASTRFHEYRYEAGTEMSKHIANVKILAKKC